MSKHRQNSDYYKKNARLDEHITKKGVVILKDMTTGILEKIDRVLK